MLFHINALRRYHLPVIHVNLPASRHNNAFIKPKQNDQRAIEPTLIDN